MRKFSVEEKLRKLMGKLSKKDPSMFDDLLEKIDEIITCKNINHYKNLRKPLQHLKRVHIKGSFILTFRGSNPFFCTKSRHFCKICKMVSF